jgi:hypothetical protein
MLRPYPGKKLPDPETIYSTIVWVVPGGSLRIALAFWLHASAYSEGLY